MRSQGLVWLTNIAYVCSKASCLLSLFICSTRGIALKTIYTINVGATTSEVLGVSLVPSPPGAQRRHLSNPGKIPQWGWCSPGFTELMKSVFGSHVSSAQQLAPVRQQAYPGSTFLVQVATKFQTLFCGVTESYYWERWSKVSMVEGVVGRATTSMNGRVYMFNCCVV